MKPMLAVDHDPKKLVFPLFGSPKIDGLRGVVDKGILLSRSLKVFPNKHVQSILGDSRFDGLDGELAFGSPTNPNLMQACTSFFMAQDKVSDDWKFHVFDLHDREDGFSMRYELLRRRLSDIGEHAHLELLQQRLLRTEDELLEYEAEQLGLGFEGLILRSPAGKYKFGRSTANEGYLLKVKRFSDSEAVIIGFEEQMENTNPKEVNELGRSKRSSHKAGKVGKDTLGALVVRDIWSGVEFNIGTGMDDATRKEIWGSRDKYMSTIVKYKSFMIGVKDAPRHPVFLGFRDPRDMS